MGADKKKFTAEQILYLLRTDYGTWEAVIDLLLDRDMISPQVADTVIDSIVASDDIETHLFIRRLLAKVYEHPRFMEREKARNAAAAAVE